MKRLFSITVCICLLIGWVYRQAESDKAEALKAFDYLNAVRANPQIFSKVLKVNLKNIKARPALIWNDTLAKVAEMKALDMAKRNYFSHVTPEGKGINIMIYEAGYKLNKDWIKDKKINTFESLQAGALDGADAIKSLIVDSYDKNLGHRKHLLGMDEWNSNLQDIGIGFAKSPESDYKTYTCVIIAKHDW